MRTKPKPLQNSPTGVKAVAPWRVREVIVHPHFRLEVEFMDGTRGVVDLSRKILSDQAGVFARLRDPVFFRQVFVEYGAVTWPGELDLAPDAMYDQIKETGQWIL